MKQVKLIILVGIGILTIGLLILKFDNSDLEVVKIITADGDSFLISAEIADTPEERSLGLMFRETLPKDSGMLFIFDDEDYRNFWMKNTLIQLDIIFIDSIGKIVDIANAVPCKAAPCPTYPSSAPAKYVLEVNGGFAEEHSIAVGDLVLLSH